MIICMGHFELEPKKRCRKKIGPFRLLSQETLESQTSQSNSHGRVASCLRPNQCHSTTRSTEFRSTFRSSLRDDCMMRDVTTPIASGSRPSRSNGRTECVFRIFVWSSATHTKILTAPCIAWCMRSGKSTTPNATRLRRTTRRRPRPCICRTVVENTGRHIHVEILLIGSFLFMQQKLLYSCSFL
jgi:hypothetical protein